VPAAAIIAPAAVAAAPAAHPDAALLAMEPRIVALAAEVDTLLAPRTTAERTHFAAAGPVPEKPAFVVDDGSYELALARFNDATKARAARLADARERLRVADEVIAHGEADGRLLAACRELAALPATTLDGLILKARMSEHDGGPDGDIAPSILEDLIALGGRA